jgi:hypothetical protein
MTKTDPSSAEREPRCQKRRRLGRIGLRPWRRRKESTAPKSCGAVEGGGALPAAGEATGKTNRKGLKEAVIVTMDNRNGESSAVAERRVPLEPAVMPSPGDAPAQRTCQIRAAILLGGRVGTAGFGAAIKRSLLDLPIGADATLLSHWGQEFSQLCWRLAMPRIMVRLVIGRNCVAPVQTVTSPSVDFKIERDPVEFRGAGGVLRDLAEEYADDDVLLVANANQLCNESLAARVERLITGGDVRLLAGMHGEPGGLFMIRCGCLRGISTTGFVDLKEQALPAIAARHSVKVIHGQSAGYSIRQWTDYLIALRNRHRPENEAEGWAFQEDWQPQFKVIEAGANVDASAGVHDSVVLAGGRVEAKATVVRSLIAPGGVVRRGEVVVDQLVTAGGQSKWRAR